MRDPVFGKTWQLDNSKSSVAASSTPATETRLYEEIGDGYKLTVSGVQEGEPYEWGYTAQCDGEPSPVHGRSDVDAIQKHRVSDLITIGSFTKQGKIVAAYRRDTSPDGKSLTVVASGNRLDGSAYFDVLRYGEAKA